MKSLRAQLLIGTSLGTAAVLLVSGVMLYGLISRLLKSRFDQALADRALSLTALAEDDPEGLEFELIDISLPEFEPSPTAEYYQVWQSDGSVFARSPSLGQSDLARIAGPANAPAFLSAALPDGRPGRMVGITFAPRREYLHSPPRPPDGVTLVLARGTGVLQAGLSTVRTLLVVVGLAAVVVSALVLGLVVRRSLHPLRHLSRQIADLGEQSLDRRVEAGGLPDELLPVVKRLNEMLNRLEEAFRRERRFTGDVAHELRTPLAGLRSKLELARSKERSPQEYQRMVGECLEIGLHLQRIVETLLCLARADAGQLELDLQPVDLVALIRDCRQFLEDRAGRRGLTVKWKLPQRALAHTDRDLLRMAVQNILDNAVSHADESGWIEIVAREAGDRLALEVSNNGWTLPADEVAHVFDRFWRADPSFRAADKGHCGLGLPMCRAVLERIGGTITAGADDSGVFSIRILINRATDPVE